MASESNVVILNPEAFDDEEALAFLNSLEPGDPIALRLSATVRTVDGKSIICDIDSVTKLPEWSGEDREDGKGGLDMIIPIIGGPGKHGVPPSGESEEG